MGKVKQWAVEQAEADYNRIATSSIKDYSNFDAWNSYMQTKYHLFTILYEDEQVLEEVNREQWDEFQDLHKD
jgi:hypothetical protein